MHELGRQKKQLKAQEKNIEGKFKSYEIADKILEKERDDVKF